ncbi:hypothetical protein Pfo_028364 [Paulownia fortunei]|nr:hypothetical protein Pfo_028364 [Paulownia fortunei]
MMKFMCNSNDISPIKCRDESSFSYVVGAENGPQNWGNLTHSWTLLVVWPSLGDLNRTYKPAPALIKNRGHDIEVEWTGDAGGIVINGTEFKLQQCHWHIPSEHTVNGTRFNMELHIVHSNSQGDIAVVGILYKLGQPDSFLARLSPFLQSADREGTDLGIVDPSCIKFEGREYYRYNGSLTTPPCSENVTWTVFKTLRTVSAQQIEALRDAVHDGSTGNARPIQPLNERPVYLFRPKPCFKF